MNSIPDDPQLDKLTAHTVGFLRQIGPDDKREFTPSGSGTLIEVGRIRGVLTAGHVLDELCNSKRIALFTISRTREKAHDIEFVSDGCQLVRLYDGTRSADRIDLGFLRLPPNIEGTISSYLSFYNFDLRLRLAVSGNANERLLTHEAIVGVIGEKSELKSIQDGKRTDTHVMTHAYGNASPVVVVTPQFDRFEFTIDHNDEVARPNSYGGLSGAAVWKLSDGLGPNDRIVFGVAYHESNADGEGRRRIYCNGPSSIYGTLVNSIRREFPREFVDPT